MGLARMSRWMEQLTGTNLLRSVFDINSVKSASVLRSLSGANKRTIANALTDTFWSRNRQLDDWTSLNSN